MFPLLPDNVHDGDNEAPSIPADLKAFAVSRTQIDVEWIAPSDNYIVKGYKIYRDGEYIGTSTQPRYSDFGLRTGIQYSYTVTAFDYMNSGRTCTILRHKR